MQICIPEVSKSILGWFVSYSDASHIVAKHHISAFNSLTLQHSQQQPPQQPAQQPLPMYFVPPALPAPPPPGPLLNMSPPQQANSSNSNPSTARYMAAYPPYQQVPTATQLCHSSAPSLPPAVPQESHQDRTQQSMGHSGMYVTFMNPN